MDSVGIIGARLNSSRLPGKHLLPLNQKPLIEHLVARLHQCQNIDRLILATTSDEFNQPLIDWAKDHITCVPYEGDVNDLMGRINNIVEQENPDFVTYICGDCPLVDPTFIDHGLHQLKQFPAFNKVNLKPEIKSIHEGIEIYSRVGWDKLYAASTTPMTREHVGYAHKVTPCLNILEIDDSHDYSSINHRISVDTAADYEFMQRIYERWYQSHDQDLIVDLAWVQSQLIKNLDLASINTHVVQKDPKTNYQNVDIFCHVSEKIGIGHLKRCSQIAKGLQEFLGFGTTIHIHGDKKNIPWLSTRHTWYDSSEQLVEAMDKSETKVWILDFHPEHLKISPILTLCKNAKSLRQVKIIAIDKLSALLDVVDALYIPAFYCDIDNPKVSYGWNHYFIEPFSEEKKRDQILVLTGGSDALGYGTDLPTLLDNTVAQEWNIVWVQGPYAPPPNIAHHSNINIVNNPENIRGLMAESKIILSCYGLSLFESIASGACTILLPPNTICDETELTKLIDEKVCLTSTTLNEAMDKLRASLTNPKSYQEIINNAQNTFKNINGPQLFSQHLKKIIDQDQ